MAVYFLYPETANVRLEDMNELFGDATTVMPTPQSVAEQDSLMGLGSPSSIDIRRGGPHQGPYSSSDAIPGLDIDPPDLEIDSNGKPIQSNRGRGTEDSVAGSWIGRMISRTRRESSSSKGHYGRIGQDED